jgi:hypothetical protein
VGADEPVSIGFLRHRWDTAYEISGDPDGSMTAASLAAFCRQHPEWTVWRSPNTRYYARLAVRPAEQVVAEDLTGLSIEIRHHAEYLAALEYEVTAHRDRMAEVGRRLAAGECSEQQAHDRRLKLTEDHVGVTRLIRQRRFNTGGLLATPRATPPGDGHADYMAAAALEQDSLGVALTGLRDRLASGEVGVRQAADDRVRLMEDHLSELRRLRVAYLGGDPG